MIAESDLNAAREIQNLKTEGYGFDAQWLDDFHHALFVLLHPDGKDQYEDFGTMEQLAKAYTEGFVHSGEYVNARKRKHGVSSAGISAILPLRTILITVCVKKLVGFVGFSS